MIRGWLPAALAGGLLVFYAACSLRYAAVWTDELSVWTVAVQQAPDKPRPHLQLALALMERRRFVEAQMLLDDTDRILREPHPMPSWDRDDATLALHQNRLLLARMAGLGPTRR